MSSEIDTCIGYTVWWLRRGEEVVAEPMIRFEDVCGVDDDVEAGDKVDAWWTVDIDADGGTRVEAAEEVDAWWMVGDDVDTWRGM